MRLDPPSTPHQHVNNLVALPACDWCRGCVVGLCMALAGCHSAPTLVEPLNLSQAKAAVIQYQDSGAYRSDLEKVAGEAQAWIETRVAARRPQERLAVIFDIDETLISNAPLMRRLDFGYIPEEWTNWVHAAEAPAIAPVKRVYLRCQELGLTLFLITGRKDPDDRAHTAANLRREGIVGYERLILAQPEDRAKSTEQRKSAARAAIQSEGYVIIANLGDQESDLRGGYSERTFKLQNPFYVME